MMPWDILAAARSEISEAYRTFGSIDSKLADDFWSLFVGKISQARETPKLYRVRKQHIRRINLGPQFKEWYVAYMIWNGKFIVLALGHAKRKPFYFINRVATAKRLHP
jgi:hypothetical protein